MSERKTSGRSIYGYNLCIYITRSWWLGQLVTVVTVRSVTEPMFMERAKGLLKVARRVKHVLSKCLASQIFSLLL